MEVSCLVRLTLRQLCFPKQALCPQDRNVGGTRTNFYVVARRNIPSLAQSRLLEFARKIYYTSIRLSIGNYQAYFCVEN